MRIPDKYYGLIANFFNGDRTDFTIVSRAKDGEVKAEKALCRSLPATAAPELVVKQLIELVVQVAGLQFAENSRANNHSYVLPLYVAWPGAKARPDLAALDRGQATKDRDGVYMTLMHMCELAIKDLNTREGGCNLELFHGGYIVGATKAAAEQSPCPYRALAKISQMAQLGDPIAMDQMKVYARDLATQITARASMELKKAKLETLFVVKLRQPAWLNYFDIPNIRALIVQRIQADPRINHPIKLELPCDIRDDEQFLDVMGQKMQVAVAKVISELQ